MRRLAINYYLNINGTRLHRVRGGMHIRWQEMPATHLMNTVRFYRGAAKQSLLRNIDLLGKAHAMELYAVIREQAWA